MLLFCSFFKLSVTFTTKIHSVFWVLNFRPCEFLDNKIFDGDEHPCPEDKRVNPEVLGKTN